MLLVTYTVTLGRGETNVPREALGDWRWGLGVPPGNQASVEPLSQWFTALGLLDASITLNNWGQLFYSLVQREAEISIASM